MLSNENRIIPLYTSKGDAEVFMHYPYLFNRVGEWVGWVNPRKDVYSVLGIFVGTISSDQRILRRRFTSSLKPRIAPPQPPQTRVLAPATIPLAPMMSEIMYSTVDVLMEEPERLHTVDSGDLRDDIN